MKGIERGGYPSDVRMEDARLPKLPAGPGPGSDITARKATTYVVVSPEVHADADAIGRALATHLAEITKPGYVAPKPWEGEPLTPKPEAYLRLVEATEGPLREIAELHGPKPYTVYPDGTVQWWKCSGCEFSGYEAEEPDWPCETTAIIAGHVGVELVP